MFENLKAGDITNLGEIKTHASPKVGQDQGSGGVNVLCRLAASVANVLRMFSEKLAQLGEKATYECKKTDCENLSLGLINQIV